MKNSPKFVLNILAFLLLLLSSCLTSSVYNEYVYRESISVKVEALNLLSKSTNNFSEHAGEVERIGLQLQKLYEFEKNRKKNEISIKMWELMLNPEKNLYAGLIKKWKDEGKLNKFFSEEAIKQIETGFDLIIGLELKKVKKEQLNSFLGGS